MILKAYSFAKGATIIINVMAALVLAMEPTVKVALIVAFPSALTGIGTLILGFLNRRDIQITREGVDGINSRMQSKVDEQQVQLTDKNEQIAHAKGRREGVAAKKAK